MGGGIYRLIRRNGKTVGPQQAYMSMYIWKAARLRQKIIPYNLVRIFTINNFQDFNNQNLIFYAVYDPIVT